MKTQTQMSAQLNNAVKQLAQIIKPAIDAIHEGNATTKNYYGDYMAILGQTNNAAKAKILALAMIEAGANVYGIESAMSILGYSE